MKKFYMLYEKDFDAFDRVDWDSKVGPPIPLPTFFSLENLFFNSLEDALFAVIRKSG